MPEIHRKLPRVAGLDPDPRHAPFRVLSVGEGWRQHHQYDYRKTENRPRRL